MSLLEPTKLTTASKGEGDQRSIILIPRSAHGTNPVTASTAGFETKVKEEFSMESSQLIQILRVRLTRTNLALRLKSMVRELPGLW